MRMRNRAATGLDTAVVDVWKREVGQLSTRNFALRLAAPEDLVKRLEIFRKLEKHGGCVNTVSFNADGDILVSGSDDRKVILWDWQTGKIRLSFHSGHHNNVFQAKFMPYTEDRCIVTCAADGQIRHAQILAHGKVETKMLARHLGRAHKLAIEPGSPYILYSCGEDGLVQRIDLRTESATERFTCQPLPPRKNYMSFIHLNAIAMDPRNSNFFAVAGSDEYARLFDIRKCKWDNSSDFGQPVDFFCPSHLVGDESVGITGLAFSDQSELLVSYNDELIYLFSKNMGLGPDPSPSSPLSNQSDDGELGSHQSGVSSLDTCAGTKDDPQAYKGHQNSETVKGVNFFGPKCEYVVSGSDCGRIFIWNKKGGKLVNVMEADKHVVNCIESHPHTTVLASSGIENDIKIWTPKATEKAVLPVNIQKVSMPRRIRFFGIRSLITDDDDDDDGGDGEYFLYDGSDGDDDDNITDEDVEDDDDDNTTDEEVDEEEEDDDDNITDEEDDVDDNITDEEVEEEEAGEDNITDEEVDDDNVTHEEVEEDEDDFFSDTDDDSNNDDTACDEALDDADEENGSEEEFYDGIDDCDIDDFTDDELDDFSNIEYDEEHDG